MTTCPRPRARRCWRRLGRCGAEFGRWLVREGGSIPGKAAFDLVLAELWEAAALPTQAPGSPAANQRGRPAEHRPTGSARRRGRDQPLELPSDPLDQGGRPALVLGNAVILKPDAQTAASGGILLARLFEPAGLAAGLLHVLPGDAEPGAALAECPDVVMISFTGSIAVGRLVGEAAGRTLKRVSLELGGNNALIVLDDADIDVASSAGAWSAFLYQGQVLHDRGPAHRARGCCGGVP